MTTTYVIADLHGRFDLLQAAFAAIEAHAGERSFKIVTLGDYVDRGPQSRQIIEWLMHGEAAGMKLICLKGNHEAMMCEALRGRTSRFRSDSFSRWKRHGGELTLKSYSNEIPSAHLDWIDSLPMIHIDKHRLFVHAGIDPTKALTDQIEDFLLWYRYPKDADIGYSKRHVVHGHTPNPRGPDRLSRRTNLDTLAWRTGRLVIAAFDDETPGSAVDYIEVCKPLLARQKLVDRSDEVSDEMNLAPTTPDVLVRPDARDLFREST